MRPMHLLVALAVLTAFPLAGCIGDSTASIPSPYAKVKETGRTIHLKATVMDLYDHQIYPSPTGPGLVANMWAFCFEPFNPNDKVSASAIEYWQPLPGDAPKLSEDLRKSCSVPGPTIRVKQGDHVKVEFSHSHFHPHTIHWHGQFVPWEMDGAPGVSAPSVKAGETFVYDFIAKKAGTLWYHCHVDTQLHVQQGLYGAFIVEPADKSEDPKDIDREYTWLLATLNREQVEAIPGVNPHSHPPGCNTSGKDGCQNPTLVGPPDVFTLNGHSYPLTMQQEGTLLKMKEGERIRLRLINAGDTVETIHPHGHDMLVTHRDGTPLAAPFWVDVLTIGPAERYDVVMVANNPGIWMIHTHVNLHETNDGVSPGGMHSMIVYEGFEDRLHIHPDVLPGGADFGTRPTIPSDLRQTEVFDFGTDMEADGNATFVVEQPCTVRQLTVRAKLTTQAGAIEDAIAATGSPLNSLRVTLRGPDGQAVPLKPATGATPTVEGVALRPDGKWATIWNIEGRDLAWVQGSDPKNIPAGGYTVEVNGRAIDAVVVLETVVDYFGSFQEAKVNAELNYYGTCPGFGQ
ncbi:MAG TPA: multicopper oxidase domain-containing protein [Candidatus Thermoplasmatota archaeon]|nr:multicopper oxidase domain-containing protein [Candidatus Thermoplasmatota archaeon]